MYFKKIILVSSFVFLICATDESKFMLSTYRKLQGRIRGLINLLEHELSMGRVAPVSCQRFKTGNPKSDPFISHALYGVRALNYGLNSTV